METPEEIRQSVKQKYTEIALQNKETNQSSCCGAGGCSTEVYNIMSDDYTKLEGYNSDAELGLGCGLPTQFAKIKKGDVILTKDSESPDDIGVPSFVSKDFDNVVCGYHLSMITPNPEMVNGSYLFRQIQSEWVKRYFEVNSNGITRFGLGKSIIENLDSRGAAPQNSLKNTVKWMFFQIFCALTKFSTFVPQKKGLVAERLGTGLQNRLQRFESARDL